MIQKGSWKWGLSWRPRSGRWVYVCFFVSCFIIIFGGHIGVKQFHILPWTTSLGMKSWGNGNVIFLQGSKTRDIPSANQTWQFQTSTEAFWENHPAFPANHGAPGWPAIIDGGFGNPLWLLVQKNMLKTLKNPDVQICLLVKSSPLFQSQCLLF